MRKTRKAKKRATKRRPARNYVVVTNRGYGNALKRVRIYFEGQRPKSLQDDGRIKFGKHILEILKRHFPRFNWIITPDTDSIRSERGIVRVRTSQILLGRMYQEEWDRGRHIKNDIVRRFFSIAFPDHFTDDAPPVYVPGTLARVLRTDLISRLSSEDRDAVTAFIPEFVASESIGTVNLLKASAQIETLRGLADDLERELDQGHAESWWQEYIQRNILLMQQGYIKALGKLNIAIGNTKFPDFSLVTHDNYLDILEIKRPDTRILKHDVHRGNYFWDIEISKSIVQVENYISNVARHGDAIRSYLVDEYKIDSKAIRPRGIILAGDTRRFTEQKQKDDFRLLSQGIKNLTILTYDELLTRLQNYINVLEQFGAPLNTPQLGVRESN